MLIIVCLLIVLISGLLITKFVDDWEILGGILFVLSAIALIAHVPLLAAEHLSDPKTRAVELTDRLTLLRKEIESFNDSVQFAKKYKDNPWLNIYINKKRCTLLLFDMDIVDKILPKVNTMLLYMEKE